MYVPNILIINKIYFNWLYFIQSSACISNSEALTTGRIYKTIRLGNIFYYFVENWVSQRRQIYWQTSAQNKAQMCTYPLKCMQHTYEEIIFLAQKREGERERPSKPRAFFMIAFGTYLCIKSTYTTYEQSILSVYFFGWSSQF